MNTRERLIEEVSSGARPDFLLFWGHTPKSAAVVDASCLSQWFPRAFAVNGVTYATAEHFMMAAKARLFGDAASLERVLAAKTPADAKAAGREVTPYDDERWSAARGAAVVEGHLAQFGQHEDRREVLLGTGERELVEASPRDRIWGIGLGASNPAARDPRQWRGQNLLGFALMEARRILRERS
jgi:ribA/ribD-fused uncharacterized protein